MKRTSITAVKATPVSIPLDAPYRWSVGIMPGFAKCIVEVTSSDGVVGLGEGSAADATLINTAIAPRLIEADPYDLADCERRAITVQRSLRTTHDHTLALAYGAVEIALWDLVGKLEERTVASLLGGRVRDKVPFTEYFALRIGTEETPIEVARYCARMQEEHGSPFFEGKVGAVDIPTDAEMVRQIRNAVGDAALLRLDANMAWNVREARDALVAFADANVSSVEEPVATFHELQQLRGRTDVAFSSHVLDLPSAVRLGVPDAFVSGLSRLGGIRRAVDFIRACAEFGINVWFYSPDTGVANAAYLQVAAAVSELTEPSQTLLRWHTDEVISEGPFSPEQGHLRVPDGPGLGVTLDQKALKRCHERFKEVGPYGHYSYVEKRHG